MPLRSGLHLGSHLHNDMSSSTTTRACIETSRGVEHHLIGVPSVHEILKKGVNQDCKIGHQKGADAIIVFFCEEIARIVKSNLLSPKGDSFIPLLAGRQWRDFGTKTELKARGCSLNVIMNSSPLPFLTGSGRGEREDFSRHWRDSR
jgi:hypothetical protein